MKTAIACLCAAWSITTGLTEAAAQDYPTRAIQMVVPYAAGGPPTWPRAKLLELLSPATRPAGCDRDRGGGGGIPGTEAVAGAKPDGHTLLVGATGPLVVSPAVRKLNYQVDKDLKPIAEIWRSSQLLAVNPKLGVKSAAKLRLCQEEPGQGHHRDRRHRHAAASPHGADQPRTGVELVHVPYRGTAAALPNVLGGQIDAIIGDVSVIAPNVKSGALVALAVTAPERSPLLPNVPTMAQSGYPSLVAESWYGLMAPAAVPDAVMKKLVSAVQDLAERPLIPGGVAAARCSRGGDVTRCVQCPSQRRDEEIGAALRAPPASSSAVTAFVGEGSIP